MDVLVINMNKQWYGEHLWGAGQAQDNIGQIDIYLCQIFEGYSSIVEIHASGQNYHSHIRAVGEKIEMAEKQI